MRDHRSASPRRRLTLLATLLWSLLLHLLLVGSSAISLPEIFPDEEDVLATRQPAHVQRIRLATRPPPPDAPQPDALLVRLASPPPRAPFSPSTATRRRRADALPPPPDAARTVMQAPDTAVSTPPAMPGPGHGRDPDPPAPPAAGAAASLAAGPGSDPEDEGVPLAPEEPAPAFPVQLSARLSARLGDLSLPLQQEWWMEGYRYAISIRGNRLGLPLQAYSEGRLAVEGGLQPERSGTLVGGRARSLTESSGGMIRLGRPGEMREVPMPLVVQDMMSLPFHLAVTFDGTARTLFVSSGHNVQQYRFTLVAEEMLRLPAGRLRTLHLQGEYFDHRLREMIRIVDVWLAVDYLNIPVRVSGHLRDGQPFEYRLEALEIEGRPVLDSDHPELSHVSDDAIPGRLKKQRAQGLKNP